MGSFSKELEDTGRMLGFSAFNLAWFAADLFGSALHEHGGFGLGMVISAATIRIFMIIPFYPPSSDRRPEGQA